MSLLSFVGHRMMGSFMILVTLILVIIGFANAGSYLFTLFMILALVAGFVGAYFFRTQH